MRLQLLGSTVGLPTPEQFAMSYLINDSLVIDAGSLGWQASLAFQKQVRHLVLSHGHLDHVASLPIWLDNVFDPQGTAPQIYASRDTWHIIDTHILNDAVWPNLQRVASTEAAFYQPHVLMAERPQMIDGITVTPVELEHIIPTLGFLIDDGEVAVALISDTAPTSRIWELCREHPRLRAVFLEASFPNDMEWLAEKTMHLTPAMALRELEKLGRDDVAVYFVHLKPQFQATILAELATGGPRPMQVVEPGREYSFH